MWHQLTLQDGGGGVTRIAGFYLGHCSVNARCKSLFLRVVSRVLLELLLLYQPPSCVAVSLPKLLDHTAGLVEEFPRLMV